MDASLPGPSEHGNTSPSPNTPQGCQSHLVSTFPPPFPHSHAPMVPTARGGPPRELWFRLGTPAGSPGRKYVGEMLATFPSDSLKVSSCPHGVPHCEWPPLIMGTLPLPQPCLRGAGPVPPPLFLPTFPPHPACSRRDLYCLFRCPRLPISSL